MHRTDDALDGGESLQSQAERVERVRCGVLPSVALSKSRGT